ncbi:Fic/DOC family N-terminal domain-containing protein [Gilvimarinus chinensis]|uniref:Fic/DOC family N-terminal domain-containing protein n=1 Tax=Gilvimarinus chinensis TaxID=396005 RepID=UPI003CCBD769
MSSKQAARPHQSGLLALGRLNAISTLLPDARQFLYSYVRKEAVMSSQIGALNRPSAT